MDRPNETNRWDETLAGVGCPGETCLAPGVALAETLPLDAPRVLVRGLANAGKTQAALAAVEVLVGRGATPSSVLLVCASPVAVEDARRALAARDAACEPGREPGRGLAGVRVATAREVELELLADPRARALAGRRPRVLTDFEESFLLEDMRVTGLPARRLKGMLGFFRKSLTELADDDMASFIIDAREQMVLDALRGHLRAYDAMLDCEVANLCVNYLRACPDGAATLGVAHVVVDDYQCLNRASQMALELLGASTLLALADPRHAMGGSDPFPYLAGVEEFCARNANACVVDLPDPAAEAGAGAERAAAVLVRGGYLDALSLGLVESGGKVEVEQGYDVEPAASPLAGVRRLTYAGPTEEFAGVACQVRELLEGGERPGEVLVLAPNRSWLTNAGRALDEAGVAHRDLTGRQVAGGSFRELDRCATGRLYLALSLLANPDDPLAWRCWCGCGDYLARSAAFAGIEDLARERGLGLAAAIELLAAGAVPAVPGQAGVVAAWEQGRALIGALEGLRGSELLAALARELGLPEVPPAFAGLAEGAKVDADAAALFERACRLVVDGDDPRAVRLEAEAEGGVVRLALYDAACALKARHVFVCGLMNGWVPPHAYFDLAEAGFAERQKMDAEARHTLYALAGRAGQTLTLTGFAGCDLELAERLHLKGYRVGVGADGRRITTCRPSDAGTYALHAWGLAGIPERGLLREPVPALGTAGRAGASLGAGEAGEPVVEPAGASAAVPGVPGPGFEPASGAEAGAASGPASEAEDGLAPGLVPALAPEAAPADALASTAPSVR